MMISTDFLSRGAALGLVLLALSPAQAQDNALRTDLPEALAKRIQAEGEARLGCKKQICTVLMDKKPDGEPVACKVVKTWPDIDLKEKILKGRLDWPWSHAQCEADIKLDRTLLAKMTSEPKYEGKVGKHKVTCTIDGKDGKESHKLSFSIDPVVTFENGKAVKAVLHWSEIDGTTLAKTAAWSATAADNTFNVLQGAVVDQINDFIGPKCQEALK